MVRTVDVDIIAPAAAAQILHVGKNSSASRYRHAGERGARRQIVPEHLGGVTLGDVCAILTESVRLVADSGPECRGRIAAVRTSYRRLIVAHCIPRPAAPGLCVASPVRARLLGD